MFDIPVSIQIGEQQLNIRNKGDYRMVLDCFAALNDTELEKEERVYCALIIFYEDFNDLEDLAHCTFLNEAVKKMYWFFNCGEDKGVGANKHRKLIDWEGDSQLIASAINKVANTEIRMAPYIHWWTFMGYYLAIGESPLAMIVGIRSKIMEGKKLEKYETKFKNDNPQYFMWDSKSVEEKEAEKAILSLWNSNN
ncbi:MAG: hypothetical protein J6O49_05475 [Bacteroidaceae bacterium]|nr:hypothetical protein [Bacteroidaceae bacterium]